MADDSQDKSQKTEEPTPRKLEQAREKGDVAKSQDVSSAAVLTATALFILTMGTGASIQLGDYLATFLARPHAMSVDGGALTGMGWQLSWRSLLAVIGAFGLLMAAAFAGNLMQFGVLWAPDKIKPEISKIDPIKGFGRLFGGEAWVNFAKTLAKVIAVALAALAAIWPHAERMTQLVALDPAAIWPATMVMIRDLLIACLVAVAVIAAIDWVWQKQAFINRNKMSLQDIKEEYRNTEGDPQIKAKLKQIRAARARTRMMAQVPKATVVIANPTHFAVALKYDDTTPAPVCVAKGVDAVALRIREIAEEAGVPVIEDPPLARALHAATELESPIPAEHYQAVARVIGFVMRLAGAKRPRESGMTARIEGRR